MRGAFQPMREIALRAPPPPRILKPLVQIELIALENDGSAREDAEVQELLDEDVPVALPQRGVEPVVPSVEQHRDADQAELDRDDRGEQDAAGPAVLGVEVRDGEPRDRG